jgi:hypothetical protein
MPGVSVISQATDDFWKAFDELPAEVKEAARQAFARWSVDVRHPSLHFKHLSRNIFSARVGLHHRALAKRISSDHFVWFWIGTHAEYDRLTR